MPRLGHLQRVLLFRHCQKEIFYITRHYFSELTGKKRRGTNLLLQTSFKQVQKSNWNEIGVKQLGLHASAPLSGISDAGHIRRFHAALTGPLSAWQLPRPCWEGCTNWLLSAGHYTGGTLSTARRGKSCFCPSRLHRLHGELWSVREGACCQTAPLCGTEIRNFPAPQWQGRRLCMCFSTPKHGFPLYP